MKKLIMFIKGLSVLLCLLVASVSHASSWASINPDELKMTSEPKAPGASAIILELQVDQNDFKSKLSVYQRIKVLTEAGRKYANVEIAYDKENESVRFIEARTIRPDGTVIDFDGEIFDKLIVKGKGIKYQAKVFTLPQVQVGSIIEYRYFKYFSGFLLRDSRWILSNKLFIKHGMFSLVPHAYFPLSWSWPCGLPPGTEAFNKGVGEEHHSVLTEIVCSRPI